MRTTSDCVICGAWIEIGDKRKTAKWKKEKKAIEDHAIASDQGSFSALFLQVVNFIFSDIQESDEDASIELNNIPSSTKLRIGVEMVTLGKIDRGIDNDTIRFIFPFCKEYSVSLRLLKINNFLREKVVKYTS